MSTTNKQASNFAGEEKFKFAFRLDINIFLVIMPATIKENKDLTRNDQFYKRSNETIHYLDIILEKSNAYLLKTFTKSQYNQLLKKCEKLYDIRNSDAKNIVSEFCNIYQQFVKKIYQEKNSFDLKLDTFFRQKNANKKVIWGDCYTTLRGMKSESVHCMVTSPPYYNARKYSQWYNLNDYLADMEKILYECYRVIDNHRVFVFNIGDIFDNDNLYTKSVWGKRRLPLGAYFIQLFEKIGWTFVDDIIWDKGEVQSERHKNGNRPYPFYQYPMNCYEHLLVFHKHRLDNYRYPCPICGCLLVNGNSYTERGLKSWECKNKDCFVRSKSNRGKRFSAKTNMTQNQEQNLPSKIDKDFIYQWRRDIKKINPVIKINSKGKNIIGHTAPFPPEIPEFAVKMFSYVGEKVLDPFMGIGTSVKVASENQRIGIGLEKDLSIKENVYRFLGKENLAELSL